MRYHSCNFFTSLNHVFGVLQLTLPPWPMFRQNPLAWQESRAETENIGSSTAAPATQKSKKKK